MQNNSSFPAAPRAVRMPAEFERHRATWMAWPRRRSIWGEHIQEVKEDYARLARTIAGFETMVMVAHPEDAIEARRLLGPTVQVQEIPIDDSWTRDSGPIFVIEDGRSLAASLWRFNAWGSKYHPHDQDALLGQRICDLLAVPSIRSEMVLEGGSVAVDGQGTLVTTESCLLNPNRNPGWSKAQMERELKRVLGIGKVIWLPGDPEETETDGHVDGLMAFVAPGKVVFEAAVDRDDPRYGILRENQRALSLQTDVQGRSFEILPLEEANAAESIGLRYCRSYVNFYVLNGAVIAPAYGIAADRRVEAQLRIAFPGRTVVMLPIGKIAMGGGGFHCITQQEPQA
jgi:agmatine deiminase